MTRIIPEDSSTVAARLLKEEVSPVYILDLANKYNSGELKPKSKVHVLKDGDAGKIEAFRLFRIILDNFPNTPQAKDADKALHDMARSSEKTKAGTFASQVLASREQGQSVGIAG